MPDFEQPKQSAWMRPNEASLRQHAPEYLQSFLETGLLGPEEVLAAEHVPFGKSSVVYKLVLESGAVVVKLVPEGKDLQADVTFFSACAKVGIQVPHVRASLGPSEKIPVSVMALDFIDAPMLSDTSDSELLARGKLREMGHIQATLHLIKGRGFGPLIQEGQGRYDSFEEQVKVTGLWDRAQILSSEKLLYGSMDDLQKAMTVMADSSNPEETSLTHNDLMPYNIFDTEPLTIYDPEPRFSHPYYCLAMTLAKTYAQENGEAQANEVWSGYEEISPIDTEILSAAMQLRYVHAVYGWHTKKLEDKDDKVRRLQEAMDKLF